MSPIPPRKPNSVRPSFSGDEREFILEVIREQTEDLGGRIDANKRDTEGRLILLERARLEDDRMRLDVQGLTVQVRALLESDQRQNNSLVALTAALKPSVEATASLEGAAAGARMGKFAGRFWGFVGSALALVAAAGIQQCQQQISRGAFDTVLASPAPASSK